MNFVSTPTAQLVMHIQCDQLLDDKCKSDDIDSETCDSLVGYYKYGGSRPSTSFSKLGAELASLIYGIFPTYQSDERSFKVSLILIESRPKKVYKLIVTARVNDSEELFNKIYLVVQDWVAKQNG